VSTSPHFDFFLSEGSSCRFFQARFSVSRVVDVPQLCLAIPLSSLELTLDAWQMLTVNRRIFLLIPEQNHSDSTG
jgi:hypothetical protein